jgi:hypothetical protein
MSSRPQPKRWWATCPRCDARCTGHDTEQQARVCRQRHDQQQHAHPNAVKDWRT